MIRPGHWKPASKRQVRFFLGLATTIGFIYYSLLRQQHLLAREYAVLAGLALVVMAVEYWKVGKFLSLVGHYETRRDTHNSAVRQALRDTLGWPVLCKVLETELLTLYYAFLAKYERPSRANKVATFGYAGASNAHDVFLFVAFSQLPFLPFIHVVLELKKGPGPAWIVTLVTLWSVVWYLAQVEATKLRPIEISSEHLKYRFGLIWSADIPLRQIKSARCVEVGELLEGRKLFQSPLGSNKNVLLEFNEPVQFFGPYLLKSRGEQAAVSVDNSSAFLRELARRGVNVC